MGLETGTYINSLVATNPVGATDPKSQGDDHLRLIKATIKASFPNINGAMTSSPAELNILDGATLSTAELNYVDGVTSAIQTQLDAKAAAALVPLLAAANNFTAAQKVTAAAPQLFFVETGVTADNTTWSWTVDGESFSGRVWNDAIGAQATWLTVDRTGNAVDTIALAATAITLNGVAVSSYAQLSQANAFTAGQTITVADGVQALNLIGPVSKIRMFGDVSGGAIIQARNAADSAYKALDVSGLTLSFTTNGGVNSEISLNGVLASDFARLSQSQTFAAQQRIAAGEATSLIIDKAGSTSSRFRMFVGAGSSFTADENYISSLNTGLHFLAGAAGATEVFAMDGSGNFDFKAGTVTSNNASASEVGYKGVPQNSQSVDYTCVLADANKHVYETGSSKTITIPANASVSYPIGTTLTIVAAANALTIAITSDTLRLAGLGTTGSRTLAAYGVATALKVTSTVWHISGAGLS